MSVKERLLHLQKFEWGKVTDDCLSQLNVGHAREILAEIDRLERERDGFKKALEQIAANNRMTSPHPVGPAMGAGLSAGLKLNAEIARAALRSPEDI